MLALKNCVILHQFSGSHKPRISIHAVKFTDWLGSNGAGKSTTIECILGTKKPDSGSISILGTDPARRRKNLFEKIGVQFQETNYPYQITVTELCEVTSSLYKTSADYLKLLNQFGLSDKLKNQVSELSGGQKQRLFIVQALIPDPEVVFSRRIDYMA